MVALLLTLITSTVFGAINCPLDKSNHYSAVVKIARKQAGDTLYCSGALLKGCYVLTAAHCVMNKGKDANLSDFKVYSGIRSEAPGAEVVEMHRHPDYPKDSRADVALLKLRSCIDKNMEVNYQASSSDKDVVVGGYGAIKLRGRDFQPSRHMGKSSLQKITPEEICVGSGGATIEADGATVRGGKDCLPTGQDSGSPFIQNGKIVGVYARSVEEWVPDGTTVIKENCAVNLGREKIKKFIEVVTSAVGVSSGEDNGTRAEEFDSGAAF